MDVYADVYFVINFSMDFICLYITCLLQRTPVSVKRLIIASCIGSVFSIISLFISPLAFLSAILTPAIGYIMCCIAIKGKKLSLRYFISFIIYMAVSFFMGGGLTYLYSLLNKLFSPLKDLPPTPTSILFPAAIICCGVSILLAHISNRFLGKKSARVTITHNRTEITVTALVDSGNLLCDPISSLPVIILCRSASLTFIPNGDFSPQSVALVGGIGNKIRLIPLKQGNKSTIISAFIPQSVRVNGESKKCIIAFSDSDRFGEHQALLPSSLLPFG